MIGNAGKEIAQSNYWDTEMAQAGLAYLSFNAGCARLLIPDATCREVPEMIKGARHVVISMLPIEQAREDCYCVEFMIEDGSSYPWCWHASRSSFDRHPGSSGHGAELLAAVWGRKNGKPHKFFEVKAKLRIANAIPCMQPFE